MTMGTLIPYGNSAWFRWLLGWLLPPQMSFLKSSHTAETREASIRKQVYQDVCFPAAELDAGLALSERLFGIYPLLLYPCRLVDRGGMVRGAVSDSAMEASGAGADATSEGAAASDAGAAGERAGAERRRTMCCNLGIYGVPRGLPEAEQAGTVFPTVSRVRQLEAWVRSVGGFQHTYCDSFQSEAEFEAMFDHSLWRTARERYGAEGVFPSIYGKTRPEMHGEVAGWLGRW